jgi:E3 ubiquitin-protein ligase SHPRH
MRAQNELSIVEKQLNATQKQFSKQTKVTTALEKEVELFTNVMNTRLEYYRQLQFISDTVAPYEGPNTERILAKMMEEEEKLSRKIATSKSKRKYLDHLRMEATNQQEQRICVICREPFEIGALTVCGKSQFLGVLFPISHISRRSLSGYSWEETTHKCS